MKIYVGNLSYQTTESDLKAHFASAGEVEEIRLIIDRDTGRSKGFGFVTMGSKSAGIKAISQFNGTELDGREIVVNEAREKQPSNNRY